MVTVTVGMKEVSAFQRHQKENIKFDSNQITQENGKENLLNLKIKFRPVSFSKHLMLYIYLHALFLVTYHKFDVLF